MSVRYAIAALLALASLNPLPAVAQGGHEEDEVTMEDLVRELEDLKAQRTKLREKVRAVAAEIVQLEQSAKKADEEAATADAQREAALATASAEAVPALQVERDAARAAAAKLKAAREAELAARRTELQQLKETEELRDAEIRETQKRLVNIERSLKIELNASRELRCMTALCWGEGGTQYAVEPVVDLPIGIAFSVGGGALTSYLNANKLSVEFNAGLRFWFWHDRLSFMIFFSKPVLETTDRIKLDGSPFEHPTASVHRPYPNIGFGFLGDLLQIGFAYDVLVNGDSATDRDPRYRANQVLSHSVTITVGFATVLSARTAFAEAKLGDDDDDKP